MTSLDKLAIRGVRAYSPDDEQVIQFLHPLTIIVGANGSGKTTIIEALRFATTGTAPDTSERGKNFIHDPRVSGRASIKGKLKLSFTSTSAKKIVAVKLFQLTQKANGKREYKQLDSVLKTTGSDGQEITISHKCSDMEKLVPNLLGVSKAILDLVIFCHQEESLWPMSDSKALKERFDDIFAATRYSAALSRIKKLRTEKAKELLEMQADVAVLQTNLEHAHKLRDDADQLRSQVASRRAEIALIESDLRTIESERAGIEARKQAGAALQQELMQLEQSKALKVADKDQLRARIGTNMFDDSDEVLIAAQADWENKMSGIRANKLRDEQELQELRDRSAELQRQREVLIKKLGQIEATEQMISNKHTELDRKISEMCSRHAIDISTLPVLALGQASAGSPRSNERATEFMRRLQEAKASKQNQLSSFLNESHSIDQAWEKQIADGRARIGQLKGASESKRSQLKAIETRRAQIESSARSNESSLGSDSNLADLLQTAQDELKTLTDDVNARARGSEIERLDSQFRANQLQLSALGEKISVLQADAEVHSLIKHRQQQLDDMANNARSQINSCADTVTELLQSEDSNFRMPIFSISTSDLGSIVQTAASASGAFSNLFTRVSQRASVLKIAREDAERGCLKARDEEAKADAIARVQQDTISEHQRRANALLERIQTSSDDGPKMLALLQNTEHTIDVKVDSVKQSIVKAEKKLKDLSAEEDLSEAAKRLMGFYFDKASADKCCPVCDRQISAHETANVLSAIASKRDKMPNSSLDVTAASAKSAAEAKLRSRRELLPVCEEYLRIVFSLLVDAKAKASVSSVTLAEKSRMRSSADSLCSAAKIAEEKATSVVNKCSDLARLHQEIHAAAQTLAFDAAKLKERASGSVGNSLESVRALEVEARKVGERLNKELATLRRLDLEYSNRMREVQSRVNTLVQRSSAHQQQLAAVESGKRELEQIRVQRAQLQADIDSTELQMSKEGNDISSKERERQTARIKQSSLEQQHRNMVDEIEKSISIMRALLDDISRASFDEQERIRTKQLATSLQSTLDQTMTTMSQCQARVTRNSETLSNEESYSRNLSDNLQYRTRLAEVQRLAQQIKDFRARLNDTVNFEDCQLKLQQLDRRRSEQQSKKDVYSGSIATNEQRCADLERDLKSDKFKDIDQKYRKKNIEFETTSMANKDLDKFYKALDKALMEFHSMKMQEINAVLSDLWRLTYKGTDIDEVVIKSDINDDGGDVAATGRKQYNYRVVMRSGDSELDMRGRCSAGQKVLASILIRLALAETFCADNGAICLDEPTTNLDSKNSRALALALNEIIERRRKQDNFQLIVITHDEEFVDLLGKREVADFFYRVSKDRNGYSIINKIPMSEE